MNISSTRDATWFSLNPVSVIATPALTNICAHARIHTHKHTHAHPYTYTQFLFGWKLTLNCSIQGTKVFLSHPKKWQVAISHHVVLPGGGKEGQQSEEAECKGAWRYWGYVLTPPATAPHPCHTAGYTCSENELPHRTHPLGSPLKLQTLQPTEGVSGPASKSISRWRENFEKPAGLLAFTVRSSGLNSSTDSPGSTTRVNHKPPPWPSV